MAGVYRPRHPERTVLYRVLFHHFKRLVAEYKGLVVALWANYSNRGKGDIFKLTFAAAKPPPSHVFEQVALTAAEESREYF